MSSLLNIVSGIPTALILININRGQKNCEKKPKLKKIYDKSHQKDFEAVKPRKKRVFRIHQPEEKCHSKEEAPVETSSSQMIKTTEPPTPSKIRDKDVWKVRQKERDRQRKKARCNKEKNVTRLIFQSRFDLTEAQINQQMPVRKREPDPLSSSSSDSFSTFSLSSEEAACYSSKMDSDVESDDEAYPFDSVEEYGIDIEQKFYWGKGR